jgi:hypothetical protein
MGTRSGLVLDACLEEFVVRVSLWSGGGLCSQLGNRGMVICSTPSDVSQPQCHLD